MSQSTRRAATLDDFWAIPAADRFHELLGGELIQKAAPSGEHGDAQAGIVGAVRPPSPGNAKQDTIKKLRLYHRVGIPHYWLVDPRDSTLTVMRWNEDGYVTLLRAERAEVVRAEPFHAVGTLFGDDPPEVP